MPTLDEYIDLIPGQNISKPNFVSVVSLSVQPFVDISNFLLSITTLRDMDTSQWGQLDDIGQWVGLSRDLKATSPGIYVPPPPVGVVPLIDDDYRILLRGKVGSNQWDGTVSRAYLKLTYIFGLTGSVLFMIDHQDMSMTVAVAGTVPSASFQAALVGGYMQVRPCGVQANYIFPTAPGGPLFGFDIQNQFISGFDTGVWSTAPI